MNNNTIFKQTKKSQVRRKNLIFTLKCNVWHVHKSLISIIGLFGAAAPSFGVCWRPVRWFQRGSKVQRWKRGGKGRTVGGRGAPECNSSSHRKWAGLDRKESRRSKTARCLTGGWGWGATAELCVLPDHWLDLNTGVQSLLRFVAASQRQFHFHCLLVNRQLSSALWAVCKQPTLPLKLDEEWPIPPNVGFKN